MLRQFKGIAILVIGRGMQILAALATIKIATSLMSPGQIGSVNQVTSLAVLLSSTFIAPVSTYLGRGLVGWRESGTLTIYLGRYLEFVTMSSVILASAMWLAEGMANFVPAVSSPWLFLLVLAYLMFFSIHTAATSGLVILERRTAYIVFTNIAPWAGLFLAVILLYQYAQPEVWLLGIFGGFLLSSTAIFVLLSSSRGNRGQAVSDSPRPVIPFTVRSVFLFAFPQAIVYVLWWVQSQSYRFILDDIAGLASVGLFFAAYALCSMPMTTFETLFNEYYSPTLYRNLKGENREQRAEAWNAYANAYIPAVVLFGMFLIGVGPYLAKILLGEEFQGVGAIIVWPAMTETMRAVSSSLYTMGIVKVDMRLNIPPVVAGALISPLLVYMLAPQDPLVGTGVALFAAGLAVLLVVIPISYRALPVKWPWMRIVQAVILGLPMVIAGAVASSSAPVILWTDAIVTLIIVVIYLTVAEYLLARKWLSEIHLHTQARQS
ncbi:MAG: hypothetical protein Tsb0026_01150 [Sulfuricaulis sp.]